ncbi:hypothetical protein ACI2KR_07510 [Pseudomonas luteola]
MNNKLKLTALSIAISVLTGCAGVSMPSKDAPAPTHKEMTKKLSSQWADEIPAITRIDRKDMLVINQPNVIPANILNQEIDVSFGEDVTVKHLVPVFKQIGIGLIIPDQDLRDKSIVLVKYHGKVGDFINALGAAYGISFEYMEGGFLVAKEKGSYMLSIPQEESVAKEIEAALKEMGAEKIKTSVMSGSISYIASTEDNKRIEQYLQRLTVNTALMSMQVAIVTVAIDRERNVGFDWSKLSAKVGNLQMGQMGSSSNNGTSNGGTGGDSTGNIGSGTSTSSGNSSASATSTSTDGTSTSLTWPTGTNLKDTQSYYGIASSAANVIFGKGNLDISAAINFLSSYGKTETSQNVLMKTLAGKKVLIKSGQKIPYVKQIGSSSTTSTVSSTSDNNVEFDDLEVGLDLSLTPYYEANSSIVAIDLDLKLDALISFLEVSAGNTVGKVSRPQTQNQEFKNYLMLPAGNTAIIGGIYYDQLTDKRGNFAPLEKYDLANQNYKLSRNALFIIIRPTVTIFGNFSSKVIKTNGE